MEKLTTVKVRKRTVRSLKEISRHRKRKETQEQVILALIHEYVEKKNSGRINDNKISLYLPYYPFNLQEDILLCRSVKLLKEVRFNNLSTEEVIDTYMKDYISKVNPSSEEVGSIREELLENLNYADSFLIRTKQDIKTLLGSEICDERHEVNYHSYNYKKIIDIMASNPNKYKH